jgi:GT2 family glycosyltransferase
LPLGRIRGALRRRQRTEAVIDRAYPRWLRLERQVSADGPLTISVLLTVHDPVEANLREAIASVRSQQHAQWECCIVDDASAKPHVRHVLAEAESADPRIKLLRLAANAGIAAAGNVALSMASGAFVAFMDHDDRLAPHALARIAQALAGDPDLDMVFSDEDQLDANGRRVRPYFKPGWNPDLLLGQNCVCHLAAYRRSLVEALGGLREGYDGSQDFDLALRVSQVTPAARIRHVPDVLYHWRQSPGSYSATRAAVCEDSARRAIASHLGARTVVAPNTALPQWSDVYFGLPEPKPLVTLIQLHQAPAPADPQYGEIEALRGDVLSNAESARGSILVFLGDIEVAAPGWIAALVATVLRDGVGCAGGRIDDRHGRIIHSGFVLDGLEIAQTLAPSSDAGDTGYRGSFMLMRTVSAVARDCLAIRRDVYRSAGGFDARAGAYGDIDLALRLAAQGLRCVWVPQARVRLRSGRYSPTDPAGAAYMRQRWPAELASDPYRNPNLVIRNHRLALHR